MSSQIAQLASYLISYIGFFTTIHRDVKLCHTLILADVPLCIFLVPSIHGYNGEWRGIINFCCSAVRGRCIYHIPKNTYKDKDSRYDKDNDKEKTKMSSRKDAMAHNMTDKIAADCNDILAFIQASALKEPGVMAAPLLLRGDKRVWNWFRKWESVHITPHPATYKIVLQDHSGLTGFLS